MGKIIGLISLFTLGCTATKFSFEKTPNLTKRLRLDGFYYITNTGDSLHKQVSIYFLYENGIFLNDGLKHENLEEGIKFYETNYKVDRKIYPREKAAWGLYKIANDTIILEMPEDISGFPIMKSTGLIINDTTFVVSYTEERNILRKTKGGIIFYFKHSDFKPDSKNNFIK